MASSTAPVATYGGAFAALNLDGVESSYRLNDYGTLFYGLVRCHKPRLVVELGTYQGYSALHLAAGLKDAAFLPGQLFMVDLWDRYPFRHCKRAAVEDRLLAHGYGNFVHLIEEDAAAVTTDRFDDSSIDLLHIDLSNDGEKLEQIVPLYLPLLSPTGLLVIEGGSAARDRTEWMRQFCRPLIRNWLRSDWVNAHFTWTTLEPFPSLTLMRLK